MRTLTKRSSIIQLAPEEELEAADRVVGVENGPLRPIFPMQAGPMQAGPIYERAGPIYKRAGPKIIERDAIYIN